jgi:adenylate cyclase
MGVEIERKFLVDQSKWSQINKPEGVVFKQGYIANSSEATIRIRIAGDKAFLTIKGITSGISRKEYEYEIPVADADEMLKNFASSWVEKKRHFINHGNHIWEVDEFSGDNNGLLMAEIELNDENERFELPDWLIEEVTGDSRYFNSNLSVAPFSKWNS